MSSITLGRSPSPISWFSGVSVLIALVLAVPVAVIFAHVFLPWGENWAHLTEFLLTDYLLNTFWLVTGVAVGVLVIGVGCAWLTTMLEFPARGWLSWALLLPLAFPAYIIAYTYTGMLDVAGPAQTLLRETFGWSVGEYWFPQVRSLPGAICMLTLVLYPYVYMLARAAFLEQSLCTLEVSRTLGLNGWQSFRRVALPLARPAIVTGLALALMEALADYGTVQYFGVPVLTTGIFRIWSGMGDVTTAAQLSALLLGFVVLILLLERLSRGQSRFHHTSSRYSQLTRKNPRGALGGLAFLACLLPVLLGFILPAIQLLSWTLRTAGVSMNADFFGLLFNSLWLAITAAGMALSLALVLGYANRLTESPWVRLANRSAALGYAVPGTVLAVGVIIALAWFDQKVLLGIGPRDDASRVWLVSGSIVALLFAYCVRFMSVSLQSVEAGLQKIKPSMDESARVLGTAPAKVLTRIHLPLMRGTVLTALLLVFVDVLKELPATLILRPFNFNTLALRAYEMANDEMLPLAGAPSLMIVAAGIVPVVLLNRAIVHSRAGDASS